ncbi:MAG: hypothetical protein CMB89_12605 [Flammeovirgaceae bacterium]|nr:hypothetical protein [Flammeovirgaceae bacterium]
MTPSDEELEILKDSQFLKLKNTLSEKVISYFSEIERALHQVIQESSFQFPEGAFLKAGKISKGEQYEGLPYFILDYPRLFTQKQVFSFRTMLWWGNHFSCTLHISGPLLENNLEKILVNLSEAEDLYFCINNTPWEYQYHSDNYLKIKDLSHKDIMSQVENNGFIKLSNFIPVDLWAEYKSFTLASFARFLKCVDTI